MNGLRMGHFGDNPKERGLPLLRCDSAVYLNGNRKFHPVTKIRKFPGNSDSGNWAGDGGAWFPRNTVGTRRTPDILGGMIGLANCRRL